VPERVGAAAPLRPPRHRLQWSPRLHRVHQSYDLPDIDERAHAFLDRPLFGEWPYLWLDATYLKQREAHARSSSASMTSDRQAGAALPVRSSYC
jgi:hypothetical protein